MASSTYFAAEAAVGAVGTTAMFFAVGTTGAAATRVRQRYDAIEIYINSTASTGWARRGTTAAVAGAAENVIIPKGRNSVIVAYSTRVSVIASAATVAYVRGIPRSMIG